MLPDDTFRAYLDRTLASLTAWRGHVTDVAACEVAVEDRIGRVELRPKTSLACPVELVLYPSQRYDIAVAGEVYENLPLAGDIDFVELLTAVTEGRIVTREERSALTGRPLATETNIQLSGGRVWRQRRELTTGESGSVARDRHYLPYRR